MNIALIGYGKMGKVIEQITLSRNHHISFKIARENQTDLKLITKENTDVAIEFTQPESAFSNLAHCVNQQVPVVCGTTGWLDKKTELEQLCLEKQSAFFYASNFSIGVNIFFKINNYLAKLMNSQNSYDVTMEEIHHTEKKDAPSGTAITLAEGIIKNLTKKTNWINQSSAISQELSIISKREPHVPGTHTIRYDSPVDFIEIKHEAKSREGFALGAVLAAEFICNKQGVFSMDDLLQL